MRRSVTMLLSGCALVGWMSASALAADRDTKTQDKMEDAQKDLNQGQRKATDDEMKAKQVETGDRSITSMDKELRDKLGDDWTVKHSGRGLVATRVTKKKADNDLGKKLNDQMRDFRDKYKDAQVTRSAHEVTLRGRIDDCSDAANAADNFAGIDGVNKIYVDLSCAR